MLAACEAPATAPEPTPPPTPPPAEPSPAPTPTPTPAPAGDRSGGSLRIGVTEPAAIVPGDAIEPEELLVVDALFDSLTRYAHNFVAVPAAASSWSHNGDSTEWEFSLREGAVFHDGTPVTAEDFVFSWTRAVREGAAGFHLRDVLGYEELRAGDAGALRGVEAVDETTLRVRLSRPRGEFPAVVAHPGLGPLPPESWQDDPDAFREEPVGNGPFAAAEARVPGQYLRLGRAPAWDGGHGPANLDEVLFQFMDPETAFVAFQQGRLQVSPLPDGAVDAAIERFGESPDGYRGPGVIRGLTPTVYFFGFNVEQPPFDDADVRRAISLAIDRERIVEAVASDDVEPAVALVPPVFSRPVVPCEACRHDPDAASELLGDRELDEITVWFNRDGGHRPVAERIRADLRAVGFRTVSFETPPFDAYREAVDAGEAGFFRYGWRPEFPLATDVLVPLFHSREIGRYNSMQYARDDVDALLEAAEAGATVDRRRFSLQQAEDLVVNRDQAVVPLMWYRHAHAVAEEVEGFRLDAMGYANLHEVRLAGPDSGLDG